VSRQADVWRLPEFADAAKGGFDGLRRSIGHPSADGSFAPPPPVAADPDHDASKRDTALEVASRIRNRAAPPL
jgi:hypothetical protein